MTTFRLEMLVSRPVLVSRYTTVAIKNILEILPQQEFLVFDRFLLVEIVACMAAISVPVLG